MSNAKFPLNWDPILRIRRNHALEHATLQILSEKNPASRLSGLSGTFGFWVLGDVDSEELVAATQEARRRLIGGEHQLAIHPNCGTNFATAGVIGGLFAWLASLGMRKTWRDRLDRLPNIISLVTIGLIIAQPLGPKMQQWVTTEAEIGSLHITGVQRFVERKPPAHRVLTTD